MINKGIVQAVMVIALTSCINDKLVLSGTYFSYWYETSFEFTFLPNGDFTMETGGHFGQTTTTGRYAMLDTIVFLLPDSDDVLYNNFGIHVDRLIYSPEQDCLRDFKDNVYCASESAFQEIAEREYNLAQLIEARLLKLPEVVQYIQTKTDTTAEWISRPKMEFLKIRTLREQYYSEYRLMMSNDVQGVYDPYFTNALMRPFLVSRRDNMIYREDRQTGQRLIEVDILFED